jgi:SNF2 family DNA or RNA helicase
MMQIQTACEGLNLQDYNEIHFVTPHWNPSVEAQAICRCWRMGQQKETHVYRYQMTRTSSQKLSSDSFDTRVFEKQEQKVKIQEKYVEGANNSWISMVRSLSMVGANYNCLPPELLDVVSSYL